MRQCVLLVLAVFVFGIGSQAQETSDTYPLFTSPFGKTTTPVSTTLPAAMPFSLSSSSVSPVSAGSSSGATGFAEDTAENDPPQVFGVRPTYDLQGYLGYTFFRFYELPGATPNTNGFNYSIVYFPPQLKGVVGADGEFVLTLGSQGDFEARFLLGMGGVRARFAPFQRNIEIWGHVLVGGSHFTPQTAYGPQGAFAYEIGGGVDINMRRERYAYRIGADMVGTHFFGTDQLSPKISLGFVYKF
jgi:hypothetical protein